MPALPRSLSDHAACVYHDHIYVFGGYAKRYNPFGGAINSLYSFSLAAAAREWKDATNPFSSPLARSGIRLPLFRWFAVCV